MSKSLHASSETRSNGTHRIVIHQQNGGREDRSRGRCRWAPSLCRRGRGRVGRVGARRLHLVGEQHVREAATARVPGAKKAIYDPCNQVRKQKGKFGTHPLER